VNTISASSYFIFKREEDKDKEGFDKILLADFAKYSKKPSLRGKYGEVFIPEDMKEISIPKGHLLLGVEDFESYEPVTLDWSDGKSFGMVVCMLRRAGKTQWVKTFALDQIHGDRGYYYFGIDPKNEMTNVAEKQEDPRAITQFKKFGIKPTGYPNACYAVPEFLARGTGIKTGNGFYVYRINPTDFNVLGLPSRIKLWCRFLNVGQMSPAGMALRRVLNKKPKDTLDMLNKVIEDIKDQEKERKKQSVSRDLLYKFRDRVDGGELGGKRDSFDFEEKLANNKIVFLETAIDVEDESTLQTYIKIAAEKVIQSRVAFLKPDLRTRYIKGLLDRPIVTVMDEADTIVNNFVRSPGRFAFRQMLTRYGQFGMTGIFITQEPNLLDRVILKQSKYVVTCKIMNEEQEKLLRDRGVPKWVIEEECKKLRWKDIEPVKQFVLIQPDSEEGLKKFFPIFPRSAIMQENVQQGAPSEARTKMLEEDEYSDVDE